MFKNNYTESTIFCILVLVSLYLDGCKNFCRVSDVQEIGSLAGNQGIVAYVTRCGATVGNSISISWKRPNMNLQQEQGDIFYAYRGSNLKIEKISPDTVKVFYFAWEVRNQKMQERGVTFVYEVKETEFFSDSLKSNSSH